MKSEIKDKWVAALRSGKYKQGKFALCREKTGVEQHCCLGVLCEIAADEGVVTKRSLSGSDRREFQDETNYLPPSVQEWAGMKTNNGVYAVTGEIAHSRKFLASDNDERDLGFDGIADIIERYAEEL